MLRTRGAEEWIHSRRTQGSAGGYMGVHHAMCPQLYDDDAAGWACAGTVPLTTAPGATPSRQMRDLQVLALVWQRWRRGLTAENIQRRRSLGCGEGPQSSG
jgi:hypothetical protein